MQKAPPVAVVVTAAGRSERFGGVKKELARVEGRSVLELALAPFLDLEALSVLVVTAPAGSEAQVLAALPGAHARLGDRLLVVPGGPTRRDSVRLGLEACLAALEADRDRGCPEDAVVLVHDGARPWASPELVRAVLSAAARQGAALPCIPLTDTPKRLDPAGLVLEHPPRTSLGGAQTPQGFRLLPLLDAHRRAADDSVDCTDDAELWARYVGPVGWVAGETANRKITFREDLGAETARAAEAPRATAPAGAAAHETAPPAQDTAPAGAAAHESAAQPQAGFPFRVGSGWDLHRLGPGRRLMLGGIEIASEFGEIAHSDGDVLLHAVIDALLGAAALGDIGTHFPPSDPAWKDADSRVLARQAARLVGEAGWAAANLDCTVVLERPRLGPHKEAIRASIAEILGIGMDAVSVKAKTKEGVDSTGEGRAIEAYATVLVVRSLPVLPAGGRGSRP